MKISSLGFWTVLSLVVGNMIGAGIFMLPSSLAAYGSLSLIGWGITVVGVILIALVFAKLSSVLPTAGGPYAYCRSGFGDFIGFQIAWTYWLSLWIGSAGTIAGTIGYLSFFFPEIATSGSLSLWLGVGITWGLTFIQLISLQAAGVFQILTTVLKISPLILVVIFGIPHVNLENFKVFNPSDDSNLIAIINVCILTMWAFVGLESGTVPAENIENPKKVIPRATLVGTLIVAGIYMVVSALIIGLVPNDVLQTSPTPFVIAAKTVFGPYGALFVAIAAIVAAVGSLNGIFMLQAQVPLAAARDRLFPQHFAKTTKNGVPAFGLVMTASLITIALFMNQSKSLVEIFKFMITLATLSVLITYLFSVLSELMLFLERPDKFKRRDLVGALALSIPAFLYILFAMIGSGKEVMMWGAFLFFASTPLYVLVKWQNRK